MFCPSCGEEVADNSTFCRHCGEDLAPERDTEPAVQPTASGAEPESASGNSPHRETEAKEKRWIDEYSIAVWLASILFALITFPVGLVIPAYLYLKASKESPVDQTPFEIWTVVLWGIFGIAAVEIGGRKGAKVLWGILGAIIVLFILVIIGAAV